nr:glycosyltransferase family 4 protein [uncultured Butyrivibrio sp.]
MEKRIRVLMVGPDRGVHGGISAVVNELYDAGLSELADITYIGTMKEGSKAKKFCVALAAYIRFLFLVHKCDVVHVHFSSDTSFYRKSHFIKAAHFAGKKIVLHQHGGDFKTFYEKELSERGRKRVGEILDMGDRMLVLTQSWKDYFSKITDSKKLIVLPNGIKIKSYTEGELFSEDGNLIDTNSVASKDYNKILFLGRVCKDKGMDELLEAISEMHANNPRVHLYIGGIYEDSIYRKKVEQSKEFITHLGWVTGEEKEKYLEECGILVLPSYYEGFPVSIIEGMLHGCAVVASAVGGIPEIITDKQNGLLISPKSSLELKTALQSLISDSEFANLLGRNGREEVIKKYSVEGNISKLMKIYKELT